MSESNKSLSPKPKTRPKRKSFKCNECGKKYLLRENLRKHKNANHRVIKRRNVLEQSSSKSYSNTDKSVNIEKTSEGRFKCMIDGCDRVLDSEDTIDSHLKEHNIGSKVTKSIDREVCLNMSDKGDKPFICYLNDCGKTFKYKYDLRRHIKGHFTKNTDPNQKFICNYSECGFEGKYTEHMFKHMITHFSQTSFFCNINECHEEFATKPMLLEHITSFHNRSDIREGVPKSDSSYSLCPIEGCARIFKNKRRALSEHLINGHSESTFVCTEEGCDRRFPTEKRMKCHVFRIHAGGGKLVNCDWPGCDYRGTQFNMKGHRLRHKSNRNDPVFCKFPGCGQSFKYDSLMQEHKHDVHFPDAELFCDRPDCQFKTFKVRELTLHKKTHREKFVCDWPGCDKQYNDKFHLKQHINSVHKNVKPYVCTESGCSFQTSYLNHYNDHLKSHYSPECLRKWPCDWPGCTYVATKNCWLKQHMVTHTGERAFACQLPGCEKRLCSKKGLRIHMATHSRNNN